MFLETQEYDEFANSVDLLIEETTLCAERNEVNRHSASAPNPIKLGILPVLGETGATKSHTLQAYCDRRPFSRPECEKPFVVISLDASIRSSKQLQAQILRGFGQEKLARLSESQHAKEAAVQKNLVEAARAWKTRAVIIDEAHHMLAHDAGRISISMASTIKSLVNEGVFSFVLLGTHRMEALYSDAELHGRCKVPVCFDPPTLMDKTGCERFFSFVQRYCGELHRVGALDHPFNPLDSVNHLAFVFDMTGGLAGRFARIAQVAIELAALSGQSSLDWQTFERAYGRWRRIAGASTVDVTAGPREATLRAMRSIAA